MKIQRVAAGVPLSLGWMLSNEAAKTMQEEIRDEGLSMKAAKTQNDETVHRIVAPLHEHEAATAPQDS